MAELQDKPFTVPFQTSNSKKFKKAIGVQYTHLYRFAKQSRFANGVIELPRLKFWEERNKAAMISPYGDIPKKKWTLLNQMIEKEEKWLKSNRAWRLETK